MSGDPASTRTSREATATRKWTDKIAVAIQLSGGRPDRPTGRPLTVIADIVLYDAASNPVGSQPISGKSMVLAQLIDAAIEGLVSAGVIYDVRQVVQVKARKRYGINPGIKMVWKEYGESK